MAASSRTGQDAPTATAGSQTMGIVEILGVAGSLSLLAGWRLYLTILATGVAMRFGWLPLPEHLQALQVLANPWILGLAARSEERRVGQEGVRSFRSRWAQDH